MSKSIFEAQETHPLFSVDEASDEEKYVGPERRRDNRRITLDRRGDVRFDLKSTDRRENPGGRRNDDASADFW